MYPLINVVTIALCAVICGADDFVAIAEFGRQKEKWFVPVISPHSIARPLQCIFAAIKPLSSEKCLLSWITNLQDHRGTGRRY